MSTNDIDYDRKQVSETSFQLITPSFRGIATEIRPGAVRWEVFECDTNWDLGRGEAKSEAEATDQMTAVMAAHI